MMNRFLPHNKKLSETFLTSPVPRSEELVGEYFVTMLTGPIPNLRRYKHRKVFRLKNGVIEGKNILFDNFNWGNFIVRKEKFLNSQSDELIINYGNCGNIFSAGIRDQIRRWPEGGGYLGKFHFVIGGQPRFLGYFLLAHE